MQNDNSMQLEISSYQITDQPRIRSILEHIGWEQSYILAFEQAAASFAKGSDTAVYMARQGMDTIGFIFIEVHAWNRLAQIQGLAVDPAFQRRGAASALVMHAEIFAQAHHARGIYVDTPVNNTRGRGFYEAIGYQTGYIMPRYYGDTLDGVTYQKFFDDPVGPEQNRVP